MTKTIYPAMLLCDFYKLSHRVQYPKGTEKLYDVLAPRNNKYLPIADKAVVFNILGFTKKYLIEYFNTHFFGRDKEEVVIEYSRYIKHTLGDKNPETHHIKKLHDLGYLPIKLKALKEGTRVSMNTPVLTIESTHPDFFWLASFPETLMTSEIWQAMTNATIAYEYRKILDGYAMKTVGHTDDVDYQLHDFSLRGIASLEAGATSGAAHLLTHKGTDNIPSIAYLEKWYNANIEEEVVGVSIPATEHSVAVANTDADGDRDEYYAFKRFITEVYPEGFVSIVSDSFDFWKVVEETLPRLKEDIMNRDGKTIIRPDCYDEKTKILTDSGWKYFKELKEGDKVAQVLDNGSYEFVKPLKYIKQKYKGEMYHFKDHLGKVDMLVTPNHRMILNQTNNKTKKINERVILAEKMTKKGNWLQTMSRSATAVRGLKKLTPIERLKIAFQADGSYITGGTGIRFSFSKERKMNRLVKLCKEANVEFVRYDLADGCFEYHLKIDGKDFQKNFDWVNTSNLEVDWCKDFIEEVSYWDATRRTESRFKVDSTTKSVVEKIELIALSAGYGALGAVAEDNREEHFSDVYTLHIMKNNKIGGQSWTKKLVDYEGMVYCVQVPSGRVLVKRNRCTLVCGNSGDPADVLCGKEIEEINKCEYVKTLEDAKDVMKDILLDRVKEDTPHGEYGESYPYDVFKFDGKHYFIELDIFWNRYDKQYYYVDNATISKFEEYIPSAEDLGLVESLYNLFGGEVNELGYKVLDSHIGAIYGDSITIERTKEICRRLEKKGFSSTNVVLGVGAYSYQLNSRDSLGFAMKATYAVINGEERMLFKDPKTDQGKRSHRGLVAVIEKDGEIQYVDGLNQKEYDSKYAGIDMLEVVFENGKLLRDESLFEIRERLKS